MRKLFVLLVLALVVMTGCVGTKIKRGVQDNTFYSTYPKMAIEMPEEFEYVDQKNSNEYGHHKGSFTRGSGANVEEFSFADRLSRKAIHIEIATLSNSRTYWIPDLNAGVKDFLLKGHEEHDGNNYQYLVKAVTDKKGNNFLGKRFGRVLGGNGNVMLTMFYVEPLKESYPKCDQWKQLGSLNEEQKTILDKFLNSSSETMKFVDLAALNLEE